jgi:hypothetical protein
MKKGLGRFEYYLIQLDDLLLTASRTEDPAKYLYANNARTPLFMLEGLSKVYAGLHDCKKFKKPEEQFKVLEDLLGAVDYADCFVKEFVADPFMPSTVRMYLEEQRDKKLADLNTTLIKKQWINHDPLRTKKIRKKLKKMDWESSRKEVDKLELFYKDAIKGVKDFYKSTGDQFTDLEKQVHEIRRKLRWLSIYPQALQGNVQLAENKEEDDHTTDKYMTPEIVNSPFNKMPNAGTNEFFLLLEKSSFLALSWMIAELGKLKDRGLKIMATAEAVQATEFVVDNIALHRAYELNKVTDDELKNIMSKAKEICSLYFDEKNLDKLVIGAF